VPKQLLQDIEIAAFSYKQQLSLTWPFQVEESPKWTVFLQWSLGMFSSLKYCDCLQATTVTLLASPRTCL